MKSEILIYRIIKATRKSVEVPIERLRFFDGFDVFDTEGNQNSTGKGRISEHKHQIVPAR